ncbi:MAG: hypothetical protein HHJ11_14815 [Phycicoccus sp.]|nr:hypothetical protein [Phycicoccus sp.]NMM33464.1 hypothetical protein [Phycicoccus sp.]
MRSPLRASLRDTTKAPATELALTRGRRAVPTQTRLHTSRIPVAMYVAALLLLPTLMVAGFMSAGLWANAETSTTQAGTNSGESGAGAEAPAAPADVKGSMTVQQVADAFPPITAAQILGKLGAPLNTPTSSQLKTLVEKGNSIDIPALRTWLQEQAAR